MILVAGLCPNKVNGVEHWIFGETDDRVLTQKIGYILEILTGQLVMMLDIRPVCAPFIFCSLFVIYQSI